MTEPIKKKKFHPILIGAAVMLAALGAMVFNEVVFPPQWQKEFNQAKSLMDTDPKESEKLYRQAVAAAIADKADPSRIAEIQCNLGSALYHWDDFERSEVETNKGADMARAAKSTGWLHYATNLLARIEHIKHTTNPSYAPSLKAGEEALSLVDQKTQPLGLADDSELLARLHCDRKEYPEAEKLLKVAIPIEKMFRRPKLNQAIADLAQAQINRRRYSEAVETLLSSAADKASRSATMNAFSTDLSEQGREETPNAVLRTLPELLAQHKFAELEKIAQNMRMSKTEWPQGTWLLSSFYEKICPAQGATEDRWQKYLDDLKAWHTAMPDSITASVATGDAYTSYGWKARGSGYANTVTKDGWRLMTDRLNSAKHALDSAKHKEACPCWFSKRQQLGLGQSMDKPEYDQIVAAGLKAWPTYTGIYLNKCWYLQPRWFGEQDEWVRYLTGAANKLPPARGDVLYARSVWYLDKYYENIFDEFSSLDRARVKRGMELLKQQFPQSLALRAQALKMALLTGDNDGAKKVFAGYKAAQK